MAYRYHRSASNPNAECTVARLRRSRAVRLVEALLANGVSPTRLAWRLNVDSSTLAAVRDGRQLLSRQQQEALVVVARDFPHLRRAAVNLESQLAAMSALERHETTCHALAPIAQYEWASRVCRRGL